MASENPEVNSSSTHSHHHSSRLIRSHDYGIEMCDRHPSLLACIVLILELLSQLKRDKKIIRSQNLSGVTTTQTYQASSSCLAFSLSSCFLLASSSSFTLILSSCFLLHSTRHSGSMLESRGLEDIKVMFPRSF